MTSWKCSSSWSGRSTIRTAGLLVDQADQADRPAGDGVGDEQLLAVDDVVVAVERGRGPQGGQVGAGARLGQGERREPLAAGELRAGTCCFCSGVPKVRSGSTAPMQPWTEASPATVGSIVAIRVRNRGEGRERGALAAVLAGRPAGPSSRPRPGRRRTALGDLAVARRAASRRRGGGGRPRASRCIDALALGGDGRRLGREQVDGELVVPDRPVHGAVGRLVPRGEQGLDLVVGPVERAGLPRLFLALAAQLQRGLDERLGLGLRRSGLRPRCSLNSVTHRIRRGVGPDSRRGQPRLLGLDYLEPSAPEIQRDSASARPSVLPTPSGAHDLAAIMRGRRRRRERAGLGL